MILASTLLTVNVAFLNSHQTILQDSISTISTTLMMRSKAIAQIKIILVASQIRNKVSIRMVLETVIILAIKPKVVKVRVKDRAKDKAKVQAKVDKVVKVAKVTRAVKDRDRDKDKAKVVKVEMVLMQHKEESHKMEQTALEDRDKVKAKAKVRDKAKAKAKDRVKGKDKEMETLKREVDLKKEDLTLKTALLSSTTERKKTTLTNSVAKQDT